MSVEEKLAAKYTNPRIQTSPELKMTEKANGRLEVGGGGQRQGKAVGKKCDTKCFKPSQIFGIAF